MKKEIRKIDLGNNSFFIGEEFITGENFTIGFNNIIRAKKFICGDNVTIGHDNKVLVGEEFNLGHCAFVGCNNDITAIKAVFGEYLYLDSNVVIGHGGKMNYDSTIHVGDYCMLCSYTKLNINYSIEIGKNVGIGEYVDVWTHGSYPNVLEGFPAQFGRVKIGDNVWLPAKSTVLPNVEIGDNVVIGVNSLINKDLPAGSMCAGIPAKVLRENCYPVELTQEKKNLIIEEALYEYDKLQEFKGILLNYEFDKANFCIKTENATFDLNTLDVNGGLNDVEEDFRDFLRRRGIKFFTGKKFRSIVPDMYSKLLKHE